jgi:hypothetical protein
MRTESAWTGTFAVVRVFERAAHELDRLRAALRAAGGNWGSTPDEEAASYPCDRLLPGAERWLFRAADVAAPAPIAFRWLCQLRVAPYSYDWIDNFGRQSPRTLTPGLEDIRPGQRAVAIFEVADVEPGESITLQAPRSMFGNVIITYRVVPVDDHRSRLVGKIGVVYPEGVHGAVLRDVLPFGDLVMMRKQLRTLAELAAESARAAGSAFEVTP